MLFNLFAVAALEDKVGTTLGLVTIDATLIFQAVNTLILFALLAKFLFHPVKAMIDERRQGIVDSLDEAKEKNENAETLIATYEGKLKVVEEEGRKMIHEASLKAEKRASDAASKSDK